MPNLHPRQKPASQDWHVADIKCALEKNGWSLSRLAKKNGYSRSSCQMALYISWPKMERLIADAIGEPPEVIWPSRWNWNGTGERRPRGRPTANRNTAAQVGVIKRDKAA